MSLIDKVLRRVRLNVRRIVNKRTAYIYPSENNGWEKYDIPLIGNEDEGTYFDPCVRVVDGRYIMFASYRNENSIIRFESDDGIDFKQVDKVKTNIKKYSHNMGISKMSNGHIHMSDNLLIGYAYSKNSNLSWGKWSTRIHQAKLVLKV